jgi:hypothetical protein
MNRQSHVNPDDRVDHNFLGQFRIQMLWLVIAVIVLALIGLALLSPWSDDSDDSGAPALPTPAQSGTPSP